MDKPATPDSRELILHHLRTHYRPCDNYLNADLRITTQEMYEKLLQQFPMEGLPMNELFQLMLQEGFQYQDSGDLNIESMLMRCLPVEE